MQPVILFNLEPTNSTCTKLNIFHIRKLLSLLQQVKFDWSQIIAEVSSRMQGSPDSHLCG